ncbi:hypothetical protein AK812_SmicGene13263 [Symbiodinium microadriaticum]|uniref:Uncharacterized protein n=1 Tax=Symbiodinium microadriaticum TaxID=2951 RepID=A0A1Q9E8K0_SYMMI|nr:hypothetical protein AK812_SmicGene13263 [Symbiodinium microadriaticum]
MEVSHQLAVEQVELPSPGEEIKSSGGLATWVVPNPEMEGEFYQDFQSVPAEARAGKVKIHASMFPPFGDFAGRWEAVRGNCRRLLPHLMDTGGFFVAAFEKRAELAPSAKARKEARSAQLKAEKAEKAAAEAEAGEAPNEEPAEAAEPTPTEKKAQALRRITKEYIPVETSLSEGEWQGILDFYGLCDLFLSTNLPSAAASYTGSLASTMQEEVPEASPASTQSADLRLAVSSLSSLAQATARGTTSRLRAMTPTAAVKDGALQNQLVNVEERLNAQILRVQQQGDRLRDVALSRMEAKVGAFETLQPKFDRRIAELSGSVKGLSDEMQSQLRRVDQIDSRLWDWRHQLEEEIRGRLSEVEQTLQQTASSQRITKASAEDSAKKMATRLLRIEGVLEEHHANAEDASTGIVQLHSRLEELEESHQLRHAQHDEAFGAQAERLRAKEATSHKLDVLTQECNDFRSRLEVQEEKSRSMRTMQDTKDEQFRALVDRVERENFEGRLKALQSRIQEMEESGVQAKEQLQILQQGLERQEQNQQYQLGRLPSPRMLAAAEPAEAGQSRVWQGRLDKLEEQLNSVQEQLEALRGEQSLAPHISALVTQLKDITPKVISHDSDLQKLREKVQSLESFTGAAEVRSFDPAKDSPEVEEPQGPKQQSRQTLPEAQEEATATAPPSAETDEIDLANADDEKALTPQQARAAWQLRQNSPRSAQV